MSFWVDFVERNILIIFKIYLNYGYHKGRRRKSLWNYKSEIYGPVYKEIGYPDIGSSSLRSTNQKIRSNSFYNSPQVDER